MVASHGGSVTHHGRRMTLTRNYLTPNLISVHPDGARFDENPDNNLADSLMSFSKYVAVALESHPKPFRHS